VGARAALDPLDHVDHLGHEASLIAMRTVPDAATIFRWLVP
jgi:hypothetical protein